MNVDSKRAALIAKIAASPASLASPARETGPEPIAIIGVSGYFPKSDNVHAFWGALDADRPLIEEIPSSRLDWERFYDPAGKDPDKSHTRWGGLIPDIRRFDAPFFHILPAEADTMDPRKRLLLMAVYHALEDAGYAGRALKKERVGVFVAAEEDEFRQCLLEKGIDTRTGGGNSSALLANQLSYFFDFGGPSEPVNTMCSGAAVAIHRAVTALRTGEIGYAVIGAANILLHPDPFVYLSRTRQMSPEPTVRSFSRDAKGFCRAEGVGSIILKPLSAARADKDAIYAVIRHSAVNYNGQGGLSMATPNIPAHTEVIHSCYTQAGIDPGRVGYIEAQGMGNPVSDIAEWEAFNGAIKKMAGERGIPWRPYSCRVSTLKPVTGHMHSASALGALLRIIRTFHTNKAHGIAGLTAINPDLVLDNQPCRLLTATEDWPEEAEPRLAGLHSFGSGGNNAHLLIEEYKSVPVPASSSREKQYVIPCSAKSGAQCRTIASSLAAELQRHPEYPLSSIAFTLQTGRTALEARVAFVTSSTDELIRLLQAYAAEQQLTGIYTGKAGPVPATVGDSIDRVARAWTEGAEIIWEQQLFFEPAARVHLPVYPYNYSDHWPATDPHLSARIPSPRTESVIRECLGRFLKKEPEHIDLQQQFSSMGFDSMLVIELSRQLEQQLAVRLEAGIFFEYNTPAALIGFITSRAASVDHARSAGSPAAQDEKEAIALAKETIAVVGLAGSFPQSPDTSAFWNNLLAGRDCIEEVPPERWPLKQHYDSDKDRAHRTGKSYGKWGGFLPNLYSFDPLFFNIAPTEAAAMNPKERLFLQCAWHVLEDAGYTPVSLANEQVGVFAGVTRSGLDPYRVSGFPVANRVSYTFNFRGPSLVIDTACSSSLIAVHEACRHILSGDCTVALAGGVHAFLDPSHFVSLSALQMLSPDGVSRSFGEKANGMVPGEGVGAVLLKPLSKALADRDHIYGTIRGSSSNHGGKSNGFTVPNPKAHADLIRDAIQKAGVQARDISYTEAHGTGTSLGDPIEMRGLTEAFDRDATGKQYCSLGSVKSNIGHLEAAAGISGLAKVLLQMKHGLLVPSLHAQKPNPQIDFSTTPFFIQQDVRDWNPVDPAGKPLPRLACISSFGAGGSNAHLIVQDYHRVSPAVPTGQAALILLSAKSSRQLRGHVQQLVTFLTGPDDNNDRLHDMAYTLQTGREAMEERLAVEADHIPQLILKLTAWLEEKGPVDKLYTGNARKNPGHGSASTPGNHATPDNHTASGYAGLLSRWVLGYPVDWHALYAAWPEHTRPSRISLPLYPFEKEYFGPQLHPLVHRNDSDFSGQLFSTLLTGEESFLKDHVIQGSKTLPGVAYLEMARAAFDLAVGPGRAGETAPLLLKNIGWAQPVIVDDRPRQLFVRLWPLEEGDTGFSIGSEETLHCQGAISRMPSGADEDPGSITLDLDKIRSQLTGERHPGENCYREFTQMGISYGTSHQALQYIQVGEGQLLAKLLLPETGDRFSTYYLHPGIMDAATQAIMGFLVTGRKEGDPLPPLAVPYALGELRVYRPCTNEMWAYIEETGHLSFDIRLCYTSGEVAVHAKGFLSRTLHRSSHLLFFKPVWVERPLAPAAELPDAPATFDRHVAVLPSRLIPAHPASSPIRLIPVADGAGENDFLPAPFVDQVFAIVQEQLRSKQRTITQILLPANLGSGCYTAVSALLKTAARENPHFRGQVITLDPDIPAEDIFPVLQACSRQPEDEEIRYSAGKRRVARLEEFTPPALESLPPQSGSSSISPQSGSCWKDKGVYLLTGGAGGLALIFAREIVRQARETVIVLAGRSALSAGKEQQLDELRAAGARLEYRQTDVADPKDVSALIAHIRERYGRLDGILHAAGILRDDFIIRKTIPAIREVLAPKVQGLINLDAASRHLSLDLFVVFSSVAGVTGNVGQADYAVANAFMDAYARHRHLQVAAGLRSGRTISIDWPLWQEGGMQAPVEKEKELKQTLGMTPLETAAGLEAFYRLIETGEPQGIVLRGEPALLRKTFLEVPAIGNETDKNKETPHRQVPGQVPGDRKEEAQYFFKKVLSAAIGLSPDRIDAGNPMEEYGIDSIMVMKMTADLEKVFGSLPKTLFFEYATIAELTDYFLLHYAGQLNGLLGPAGRPAIIQNIGAAPVRSQTKLPTGRTLPDGQQEGIAIIGLSGQYPQARTLGLFWENLLAGRNCISEIPEDRWDHSPYFDPDNKKPLKTNTKWGGFLEGMDEFDPLFFNISFKEAETIDPQERLFLQCAYAAIEDAGYTRQLLGRNAGQGNVGVYVGVMWNEYQLLAAGETALGRPMVLSSGSSSIANRVSYYCNFNGPSIAVDTMCSSSLTSIHLACQSLLNRECGIAIAGGVNVSIHPNKYLILGYSKMASAKGLCESFGKGGDGYVPSEGVGAVILKPLSRAVADGDQIYGVIRGSAVNHGGKVNGYSVPNPKAQGEVIGRALRIAGWDPRTVSYIEAHGTGTALGDPIEIAGLSGAFEAADRQSCAIGSVKSNIGHCESAAGIAGLTKVLLQMKHGILAPSLHSSSLNENIDFEKSPFRVQQEVTAWKRPAPGPEGGPGEYPRRAGISSFGAGGSNAHIVVEEYISPENEIPSGHSPGLKVAIVLSAKDETRLKEVAAALLSTVRQKAYPEARLGDMAYTLQTGREAMEQRVAMEVSTLEEMEEKLSCFIRGDETDRLYIGKQQVPKDWMPFFTSDEDMEQALENWFNKKKYARLLELWVHGIHLDWDKLYAAEDRRPRRLSLPTYPFSRERYWPEIGSAAALSGTMFQSGGQPLLHPLVHENTSTFSEQRFTSTFTGQEFFLADHRVNGEKTLPGVACIEMIREAVCRATGDSGINLRLENMAWAGPIQVNGHPQTIDIRLAPGRDGNIDFEITTRKDAATPQPAAQQSAAHTRGIVRYAEQKPGLLLEPESIRQSLTGPAISAEACYDFFTRMGISYGPGHRAIESLLLGEGELLAKLHLPSSVAATASRFYLHPALMDAAFQAIAGFWVPRYRSGETIPLMVPFAANSITILAPCSGSAWVHVRAGGNSFDLDISDAAGNICVEIRGLTIRQMGAPDFPGLLLLEHYWQPADIAKGDTIGDFIEHTVFLIGNEWPAAGIRTSGKGLRVLTLQAPDGPTAAAFESYATAVFNEVQRMLKAGHKRPFVMQVVTGTADDQAVHNALAGLLKTAKWENPLFTGQVIGIDPGTPHEQVLAILNENLTAPADTVIRYQAGRREVLSLRESTPAPTTKNTIWQEGGIYLITGGAGGLGLLFAGEISAALKNGVVILAGRSPLSPALEQRLSGFSSSGIRVLYRQADIAEAAATQRLIQSIIAEFGALNGIIHSAGLLHDNLIIKKDPSEIKKVLAPKVSGTENLDRATSELPLDFFLCCSSVSGMTGNAGQSDYALANAFQDAYAAWRQGLVEKGGRQGKTLSLGWPLWEEGGMRVSAMNLARLREQYGIEPLRTDAGMHALAGAMNMEATGVMVLQGNPVMLRATFLHREMAEQPKPAQQLIAAQHPKPASAAKPEIENWLKGIMSSVIKVPANRIMSAKTMEEYGIDSVMILQMTHELEKRFGSLSKTLFFEYRTIGELADYFLQTFPGRWDTSQADAGGTPNQPEKAARSEKNAGLLPNRFTIRPESHSDSPSQPGTLDIAIIGLAGRYPGAENMDAFWKVLRDGRDCITEIPGSRWDHGRYFDEEKNKAGKTYGKWGGFLDRVDTFDPGFFNITPKEAETMDPQERLFLECVYEAIEDAGYTRDTLGRDAATGKSGHVGVMVGVMTEEYQLYGPTETARGRPLVLSGNSASIANRVSYFCNFNGPSIALNTMCSSSLTTIHLACQSLMAGECRAAIAGGVNVTVHPNKYLALAYGSFLSSRGLCESFGADGDGYVPGEGVGAVILKPLAQAIADKDHIYAVVKASSINHGGRTNGYTVPNPVAQSNVIGNALLKAGFDPRTVSYLEAHGTGTSLGDPIEINGLIRAFDTGERQYCAIGSVKSNIGHCESAAGIAGVTKVLLQMKYGLLAPSLHAGKPNPHIDFAHSPFKVQKELAEWRRPQLQIAGVSREYPRRAGISSFGAGGANAHLLLEEYIDDHDVHSEDEAVSFAGPVSALLSARNEQQLKELAIRLVKWVEDLAQPAGRLLADMAYTLRVGREIKEETLSFQVSSFQELRQKLNRYIQHGIKEPAPDRPVETTQGDPTYRPRRISLPTYPFLSRRCWFNQQPELPAGVKLLQKQWDISPPEDGGVHLCRNAVILHSKYTQDLAVLLGQSFQSHTLIDTRSGQLPHDRDHGQIPWESFDVWIDITGCGETPELSLGWVGMLQHFIQKREKASTFVLGLTRGLTRWQHTAINLAGAPRAGLYRMLGSEYSHIYARHVDIAIDTSPAETVLQILRELSLRDKTPEACYRNGHRYQPDLREYTPTGQADSAFSFSVSDRVLITGGTRGLGYLCAQHLLQRHGVRRFILTGRERLPARETWKECLSREDGWAEKIRKIQWLEAAGAELTVLDLSLTDPIAMERQLAAIPGVTGHIHGVIHCAGIGDRENPAFVKKTIADIQAIVDPKIQGTENLYRCLQNEPLRFFVLFSSVAAAIPSLAVGQAAYAMANAYMDHFAEARSGDGKLISIQWPSWKETGMGEIKTKAYQDTGLTSLTNAEGLQILDYILANRPGPVLFPKWTDTTSPDHTQAVATTAAPGTASSDQAENWLTGLLARELKLDVGELKPDKAFQDYGIDSIMIAQLLQPIKKALNKDIDPSILFEYSTIRSFASWLREKHPQELAAITTGGDQAPAPIASGREHSPARVRNESSPTPAAKPPAGKAALIAVTGMSCRLPGANDIGSFWDLLQEGRSAISTIPAERWRTTVEGYAGLIDHPYHFDPAFFLLAEDDARAMDPQALIVLEESLSLFHHAGYTPDQIKGKSIGVYLGGRSRFTPSPDRFELALNPAMATGQNYLAANISRFFDLRGPSLVVDTACSSALVAMKIAMQALQENEADAAVVGGINLLHSYDTHQLFRKRGLLSKGQDFHILDRRAGGIILGEGAGMVLLKTVDQALKDGDRIYAIINSISINNDGRSAGPATPNITALREVMQNALQNSGKKADDIGYIEVNGSGSEITDIMEIKAISSVYRPAGGNPCRLGSLKPNIGHPLAAEGIAAFIKVVCMLHHRQFVPFLSGQQPMKHFDLSASPFLFPRVCSPWAQLPATAAINCFADGGTNAHVIVEAWNGDKDHRATRGPLSPPVLNRRDLSGEQHMVEQQRLVSIWETFE